MAGKEKLLGPAELAREYPSLEEWFANPQHHTANLQDKRRLMSWEERLLLAGGTDQVKNNLARIARNWRNTYVILLACQQSPLSGYEVGQFGRAVGIKFNSGSVTRKLFSLADEGYLSFVTGLTYVTRSGDNPNQFRLREGQGFLSLIKESYADRRA